MNENEIKPAGPVRRLWSAVSRWLSPPARPMTPEEYRLAKELAASRQKERELIQENQEHQHENGLLRKEIDNLNRILNFHHERWDAEAAIEARRAVLASTQMPPRPGGYPGG